MSSVHQWNTAIEESTLASLATTSPEVLAALFGPQDNGCHWGDSAWGRRSRLGDTEFSPAVDVFDTPTSYAIHVSLPGARREDIGVNYDEVIV